MSLNPVKNWPNPRRADELFCFDCGNVISARAEICPLCGVRQQQFNNDHKGRSKVVAALLALFLGGLGVHKFYLGRPWQGVFYLLLCMTLIPTLIGFVEGLVYLAMRQRNFDVRYNDLPLYATREIDWRQFDAGA